MKTVRYFVAFLVLLAVSAASADTENDWQTLQPEALTEPWREVFEALQARRWVEAEFVETRVFPFRRGGVELKGTLWFGREEGLTLNYREPRDETIRIDETGMRVIRKEDDVRRIRGDDRAIPETLLALFRFDLSELENVFELRGRLDGSAWRLQLIPRDDDAPLEQIEIGGETGELTAIDIRQTRSRRIEIRLSKIEFPETLDEAELARRFP